MGQKFYSVSGLWLKLSLIIYEPMKPSDRGKFFSIDIKEKQIQQQTGVKESCKIHIKMQDNPSTRCREKNVLTINYNQYNRPWIRQNLGFQ